MHWSATLAVGFIAGIASVTAGYLTFLNTNRSHDIQMVEIGLSILRGEADMETARPARTFALQLIEKYSDVEIEDFDLWLDGGETPFDNVNRIANNAFAECDDLSGGNRLSCMSELVSRSRAYTDAYLDAINRVQSLPPAESE